MMHKAALACTCFLLLYWLPADVESIRYGLEHHTELTVGISLKIFMHLAAIVGLSMDKGFGYVFLLGASVQGLIVAVSALRAIPLSAWWLHKGQLIIPAVDVVMRVFCVGVVGASYRKILR